MGLSCRCLRRIATVILLIDGVKSASSQSLPNAVPGAADQLHTHRYRWQGMLLVTAVDHKCCFSSLPMTADYQHFPCHYRHCPCFDTITTDWLEEYRRSVVQCRRPPLTIIDAVGP